MLRESKSRLPRIYRGFLSGKKIFTITILTIGLITFAHSQGITNTLGGNTANNKFIIENSDSEAGLIVTGEGNVGIGTESPQNKLDIEGGVVIGADYSGTNTAPENGLLVNGNVGIGTSNPKEKLHVYDQNSGYTDPVAIFESNTNTRIAIRGPGNGASIGIQFSDPNDSWKGGFGLEEATNNLTFSTNADGSNPRMVITNDGKVGIGTTNPNVKLHVFADGDDEDAIYGESVEGSGVNGLHTHLSQTAPAVFGRNTGSGPGVYGWSTYDMGVAGKGGASSYDFYAAGQGTNYGASSSIRWKRNIVEIDKPLEKLAELRGVYFDWDEEHGGEHDVGMIAEEVGKVLPEIVVYEENGVDANGMDYSMLTPLLVEVAKAQQKLIEDLTERIDFLESK